MYRQIFKADFFHSRKSLILSFLRVVITLLLQFRLEFGKDRFAQMASIAALRVRKNGHGKDGYKRPVLFPKLVFWFDKNLHDKGKELYPLFQVAIDCSKKVMYPEYLSLTGESGIVSEVYKKYGKVISPICCRAFLTKWFEWGGESPAEMDEPVFNWKINIGVVSHNLPMILAKSRESRKSLRQAGETIQRKIWCYRECQR